MVDSFLDMNKGCGWAFGEKYPDPHHPSFTHLKDVYRLNDPDYNGRVTVPVLFDLKVRFLFNRKDSIVGINLFRLRKLLTMNPRKSFGC